MIFVETRWFYITLAYITSVHLGLSGTVFVKFLRAYLNRANIALWYLNHILKIKGWYSFFIEGNTICVILSTLNAYKNRTKYQILVKPRRTSILLRMNFGPFNYHKKKAAILENCLYQQYLFRIYGLVGA